MSLGARLNARGPVQRCSVGRTLTTMPADDREAALDALRSDRSTESIVRAMTAEGYSAPATSVQRHRMGRCRCESV